MEVLLLLLHLLRLRRHLLHLRLHNRREAGELGRLVSEAGEVGRAGSSMVELEGIVEVNVMIGDIIGEVRISVGMGSRRSCWF